MTKYEFNDLPPCLIHIDKEGQWYHKGAEMIRRDFIRIFYENMAVDSEGRYVILWGGKRCYVDVEDTAFVVWNMHYQDAAEKRNERYVLHLSDDSSEQLIPESLYVGNDNVLYCKVKEGAFPARFSRAAYYQLATHVVEEDGHFYLPFNHRHYAIKGVSA